MTRNKRTIKVRGAAELAKTTRSLRDEGFSVLPGHYNTGGGHTVEWGEVVSSQLHCGTSADMARGQIPLLYASSGNEQMITSCGTPGLGWMEWGMGNRLPNVVSLLTLLMPFTAASWKFNTDLVSALGPRPKYRYSQYVCGNLVTRLVPYADAGVLIKGRIVDLMRQIANLRREDMQDAMTAAETPDKDDGEKTFEYLIPDSIDKTDKAQSVNADLIAELEAQLAELREDYDEWQQTNEKVRQFVSNNNLPQTFLELFGDEEMLGMCFPEIQLNAQQVGNDGKPVSSAMWKPEIVGISARKAHTCRLERMDKANRINYVYVSNRWYDTPVVDMTHSIAEIAAIPALSGQSPVADIERRVREARAKNVRPADRPTRFILPSHYPTPGRPYYPLVPWHSIYGGDIYEYGATIISDRFTRRKNSNVIGRVIYINNDYLNSLYIQMQADTADKKNALRDKCFAEINSWLRNRDNSGQSLVAFTFTGADGKEHESFKIVEIESASKQSAEANQTELAEVSSVIFYAMGLDAQLVGNTPGAASGGKGGTDLRERYLLKQIQKSPTQRLVLKIMDVVRDFNKWDTDHLVWEIERETLTTLDNSKTGITTQQSN